MYQIRFSNTPFPIAALFDFREKLAILRYTQCFACDVTFVIFCEFLGFGWSGRPWQHWIVNPILGVMEQEIFVRSQSGGSYDVKKNYFKCGSRVQRFQSTVCPAKIWDFENPKFSPLLSPISQLGYIRSS